MMLMKTKLIAVCLLASGSCFAQDKAEDEIIHSNFIYGSPFGIFVNRFTLSMEHNLPSHNSFMVTGSLSLSDNLEKSERGGGGEFQYRVNMSKHPDRSSKYSFFYFAPYMQYRYMDVIDGQYGNIYFANNNGTYASHYSYYNEQRIIHSVSGGLLLGIRLTNKSNRLSFDLFAGGGMKYSDVSYKNHQETYSYARNYSMFDAGYTGVVPRGGFQVGVSF